MKYLWPNSRFFHVKASHRRRKNLIQKLKDEYGEWREDIQMHNLITKHFKELYLADSQQNHADFLDSLTGRVSEEMSNDLIKPYAHEEIHEALQQMKPEKAPSLDGMSPIFFQKY